MTKVGIEVPRSGQAYSLGEAIEIAKDIGFPLVIRPSFTLGGQEALLLTTLRSLRTWLNGHWIVA